MTLKHLYSLFTEQNHHIKCHGIACAWKNEGQKKLDKEKKKIPLTQEIRKWEVLMSLERTLIELTSYVGNTISTHSYVAQGH